MQDIPREQVIKRIQLLPESLQTAVFSDKTVGAILKNCALRDITPKQTYFVGALTRRVLLGYLRPEQFAEEIRKETGVEEMTSQHIAHDIDMEIFSEVRLELKKLYPPMIQTPTVQSQGFTRATTPPPSVMPPQPKPRYVIPIPEKFLKQTTYDKRPTTNDAPQTQDPQPAPQPETQNAKPVTQENREPIQQPTVAQQQPEPTQKTSTPEVMPQPAFKPIVPLPTFIQSKFKATPMSAGTQPIQPKPVSKEDFSKFTTSSTAQPKPETKSPYREDVKEQKSDTSAKKVIDLSGF